MNATMVRRGWRSPRSITGLGGSQHLFKTMGEMPHGLDDERPGSRSLQPLNALRTAAINPKSGMFEFISR